MSNTIKLDLGALAGECEEWFELQIEVDYEVDAYDKGDWTTPPSGGGIHIFHCWLGIGDKKVDILGALDSLDLDLHETIMEALDAEDLEQEPDADHAMELARDREMGL